MPVENSSDVGARKAVEDTVNAAKLLSSALLSANVMDSVARRNLQIKIVAVIDLGKDNISACFFM